jgi:hypothetical protein
MKDKEFQQKLVDKLRSGKLSYGDAPIYTIILELVQGNGEEEVFRVFNEVIMEEPKQETIEEVSFKYTRGKSFKEMPSQRDFINGAVFGAQWQAKRMYSEEEVENILIEYIKTNPTKPYRVVSWFQQIKKK